jgi:peptide chain release factor subunit 3
MTPFLRTCGYQPKDFCFLPIAGLMGVNVNEKMGSSVCSWYDGPALFEVRRMS